MDLNRTKGIKLNILYLYPDLLNLYGDRGNIEILVYRSQHRNIPVNVFEWGVGSKPRNLSLSDIDIVFMGGGPDSSQKELYSDLLTKKRGFLYDFIERGGAGLFVCGSYQLLGSYYMSSDSIRIDGLDILPFYTLNFSKTLEKYPKLRHKLPKRLIGNTSAVLNNVLLNKENFKRNNSLKDLGTSLVGFENHGGRTFFDKSPNPSLKKILPFAQMVKGYGNNGIDGTEGVLYKNTIGTYFHGPILAKNPHIADFLISVGSGILDLPRLDDSLIYSAHKLALTLPQ